MEISNFVNYTTAPGIILPSFSAQAVTFSSLYENSLYENSNMYNADNKVNMPADSSMYASGELPFNRGQEITRFEEDRNTTETPENAEFNSKAVEKREAEQTEKSDLTAKEEEKAVDKTGKREDKKEDSKAEKNGVKTKKTAEAEQDNAALAVNPSEPSIQRKSGQRKAGQRKSDAEQDTGDIEVKDSKKDIFSSSEDNSRAAILKTVQTGAHEQASRVSSSAGQKNGQAKRNKIGEESKLKAVQGESETVKLETLRPVSSEEALLRITVKDENLGSRNHGTNQEQLDFSALQTRITDQPSNSASLQSFSKLFGQQFSSQVVKQAAIILNRQNSGEIRMIVEPRELGELRIRLQLENNTVLGKIVVDNEVVRTAVEDNMESLQRAFAEQGLQIGQMEVSVRDEVSEDFMKENTQFSSQSYDHTSLLLSATGHTWYEGNQVNLVA